MDFQLSTDFDSLNVPISGESPAGIDLRKDNSVNSSYYQIRDARSLARSLERRKEQGDILTELPGVEWQKVLSFAKQILATKSKDLEICAWMIESLVREQQFRGLAAGFYVTRTLCEQYWELLYPLPDADGIATKVAAITGLNGEDTQGTLITPIANVPITQGKTVGPYTLWEYVQAKNVSQIADPDKRAKRIEQGAVAIADFEKAVAETDKGFFAELINDLENCISEYSKLIKYFDEKCGNDSPPSSQIREALTSCLSAVKFICKDIIIPKSQDAQTQVTVKSEGVSTFPIQKVGSREEAFNILLEIGDYFLVNEPHSPISYLIKKVVRWGKMPLPDLLKELITDERVRNESFILTGIVEAPKNE